MQQLLKVTELKQQLICQSMPNLNNSVLMLNMFNSGYFFIFYIMTDGIIWSECWYNIRSTETIVAFWYFWYHLFFVLFYENNTCQIQKTILYLIGDFDLIKSLHSNLIV